MAATTASKNGPNGDGQNGWTEYRRLVLAELERLSNANAANQLLGTTTQLVMTQAINDAKQTILDKLRDTMRASEEEFDKKLKDLETRLHREHIDLKKSVTKQEKDLEKTDKKQEKTDKELTSLKAKAMMLGALAGFIVAVCGVLASIFIKK